MNWKTVGLTVMASLTLTACGADNGQETGQGLDNGIQQVRFNGNTDFPTDTTGNNGNVTNNNRPGTYNGPNDRYTDGNGFTDNEYGINNRNINNQADVNNRNNRNMEDQQNNEYDVNEEISDRIADQVDDIDRAYVLTTDNNAYVAAELSRGTEGNNQQNGDNVSDQLEEQISKVVKDVDNNIDDVYVSTNPDFVNLTNNYVEDVNNGEPIEGFFEQMGEMIQRVFPQNR